jgi:hypothetical protein
MTDDQLREQSFGFQRFNAPSYLPLKEQEEIRTKRAAKFYAGFEADPSADCILSWLYGPSSEPKASVPAGLPVRHTFDVKPAIGDIVTFTPILTALYGAGRETSQEPQSGKVVSIKPSSSNRFDYTVTLEHVYEKLPEGVTVACAACSPPEG